MKELCLHFHRYLMQKLKQIISQIAFPNWSIPLFLLLETIIAFGLLAPFLGYYFDDWQMIWLIKSGSSYWEFYAYDRPFSAWTLYVTAPILGTKPLSWHIFTMLLRWLITCSGWWVLKQIWPQQKRLVTLIAILFAVFPAFLQQPISVAYSQHFITYLSFLLSFGCMLYSMERGRGGRWLFTILALVLQGLHLFTMEYFWGLELVRPLGIFLYYQQRQKAESRKRLNEAFKTWLPYLLLFMGAILWRVFIYAPIEDPNELRLLTMFRTDAVGAFFHFLEMILRDSLHMLIKTWDQTLQVGLIDLDNKFLLGVWLIVLLVAAATIFYLRSLREEFVDPVGEHPVWRWGLLVFGLAVMLAGPLPVWITNKQITIGMYSDRFALAGMFGAAILLVLFLDSILSTKKQVLISVAILAGLATGLHIRTANDYRWENTLQERLFWQLHWRVPNLEPGTAIFSDGAIFQYTGDYPTAFALNMLYPHAEEGVTELPFWFFELDRGFQLYFDQYLNGQVMEDRLRTASFEGTSLESILIDYNPRQGNCLWVVAEGDELVGSLPGITVKALPLSDLSRIDVSAEGMTSPDPLFGSEPAHTWCYYFQKAELARQVGDWERVAELADHVVAQNFDPQNRFEWRPFVDGYLHTEQYADAYQITELAYQRTPEVSTMFCAMWLESVLELPEDAQLLEYAELAEDQLRCKWAEELNP